ncbi:hypothetical protein Tco_0113759, partial [Tanacetum coccineum]
GPLSGKGPRVIVSADVSILPQSVFVRGGATGAALKDGVLSPELEKVCLEVSRILRETGALLVRDPRCSAEDADRFISMTEKYFEMPDEFKLVQARPDMHYQFNGNERET